MTTKCFHNLVALSDLAKDHNIPLGTLTSWAERGHLPQPFYESKKIRLYEREDLMQCYVVRAWLKKNGMNK